MVSIGSMCSLTCSALWGGLKHGAFSWTLNATDLGKKVFHVSAPLFKTASLYGAFSGLTRYSIRNLSFECQKASKIEDKMTLTFLNAVTVGLEILSRYGVAYLLIKQARMKLDIKYVHITVIWAAFTSPYPVSQYTQDIYETNNPIGRREAQRRQEEWIRFLQRV